MLLCSKPSIRTCRGRKPRAWTSTSIGRRRKALGAIRITPSESAVSAEISPRKATALGTGEPALSFTLMMKVRERDALRRLGWGALVWAACEWVSVATPVTNARSNTRSIAGVTRLVMTWLRPPSGCRQHRALADELGNIDTHHGNSRHRWNLVVTKADRLPNAGALPAAPVARIETEYAHRGALVQSHRSL